MEKVRIQDDLYTHVNQETLDQLVIPDDKPTAGGFAVLADGVEKLMMDEFNEMSASGNYPNDYLKRAVTLFNLAGDAKRKARHGIKPASEGIKLYQFYIISLGNKRCCTIHSGMVHPLVHNEGRTIYLAQMGNGVLGQYRYVVGGD